MNEPLCVNKEFGRRIVDAFASPSGLLTESLWTVGGKDKQWLARQRSSDFGIA